MGKKKSVPIEESPGGRLIRLQIGDDEQAALQLLAAKHRMGMAALARWIVRDYLRREREE